MSNPLTHEIQIINRAFAEFGVGARVPATGTGCMIAASSHISYRLQRARGQRIQSIEKLLPELTEAVTESRGIETPVRLLTAPLALEVPHPRPKTLTWDSAHTALPPHAMLAGRRYQLGQRPAPEIVRFDDTPHVLVCGVTGAGKSIMMSSMLGTLCLNTSPEDLRILLIDLKNEDMIPFANLPHVERFAGMMDEAEAAISSAIAELDNRIAQPGYKPYRLVVWIDEVAELATQGAIKEGLGRLASAGRSKGINLVCATTYPTEKGGLGQLMKANFPLRLVGMVASGQSYTATQRPKLYADLLPGRGSFLRIEGNGAPRFQSHYLNDDALSGMIADIDAKWAGCETGYKTVMEPQETGYETVMITSSQPVITGYNRLSDGFQPENGVNFPISGGRPITGYEIAEVQRLASLDEYQWAGQPSTSRLAKHVYGSKDPQRMQWIKDALAAEIEAEPVSAKIIPLRRSANG